MAFLLPLVLLALGFMGVATSNPILDPSVTAALAALGKTPADLRLPGSLPNSAAAPGTDMLPGIDHIVVIMMENHSFDNIWGTLDRPDVDGYQPDCHGFPKSTQKYANGTIQHLYIMPKTCTSSQNGPTQNWANSHLQYDNGSMDGFVTGGGYKPISMAYMVEEQLPFTHSLGKTFPIGDRYFCSLLGQTWPNRMFLIAATAMGAVATGQNITGFNPPSGTIFNTLDKYNVSWANYWIPNGQSTLELYAASNDAAATKRRPYDEFFTDAAAGVLPQFSFIDYNFTTQSQENPQNMVVGEAMLYDIVTALGASPQWNRTLLIINYDEHGGYYDHVPPPPALAPDDVQPISPIADDPSFFQYEGYQRYGFRVPVVVVSPWAKKGHVSHLVYDHTSVLAFIEKKWNLPALTMRDANALDMTDFIDLNALKSGKMNFPDMSALQLSRPGNTTEALQCTPADPGVIPPPNSVQNPKRNL